MQARQGPSPATPTPRPDLSVVAPAHNEQDNVAALADEVENAVSPLDISWELVIVDDGSTDSTRERLLVLAESRPWLRPVAMKNTPNGKGSGQSAAFHAGFRASRGRLIATMDADLQNDPADLPMMLRVMRETSADLVQGDRSRARRDNVIRKVGSLVGRAFRRILLGDTVRDTGCSLRVLKREFALRLPLELRGMHRFVPITVADLGGQIVEVPVNHRPRTAGQTKYGLGIVKRAIPGLIDLFAVLYFRSRRRDVEFRELEAACPDRASGAAPSEQITELKQSPAESRA